MSYLDPAEYLLFGLGAETPDALVAAACAMVDAFCRRASLLVMAYVERLRVQRGGQTLRLSNGPLLATGVVTACRVRMRKVDLLHATPLQRDAAVFGLSGAWSTVDPAQVAVYANGEVELPANVLGVSFDEAEISYQAGYTTVPIAVKIAIAQIVRNAQATPGLNVKRQQVDAMAMEYFAPALLDDEVKRLLQPFVSVRFG